MQSKSDCKMYFIIMSNVFHTEYEIHQRYDLKGSLYKRSTPPLYIYYSILSLVWTKVWHARIWTFSRRESSCRWILRSAKSSSSSWTVMYSSLPRTTSSIIVCWWAFTTSKVPKSIVFNSYAWRIRCVCSIGELFRTIPARWSDADEIAPRHTIVLLWHHWYPYQL